MNNNNQEFVNTLLKRLVKLNYIKPGDVPNIDLYMDQVTTFMDEHLSDVKRHEDDKILLKLWLIIIQRTSSATAGKEKIFKGAYIRFNIYILP